MCSTRHCAGWWVEEAVDKLPNDLTRFGDEVTRILETTLFRVCKSIFWGTPLISVMLRAEVSLYREIFHWSSQNTLLTNSWNSLGGKPESIAELSSGSVVISLCLSAFEDMHGNSSNTSVQRRMNPGPGIQWSILYLLTKSFRSLSRGYRSKALCNCDKATFSHSVEFGVLDWYDKYSRSVTSMLRTLWEFLTLSPPPAGPGVSICSFSEIAAAPVELILWAVTLPKFPSIVLVSLHDVEALSTRLVIPEKMSPLENSQSGHLALEAMRLLW